MTTRVYVNLLEGTVNIPCLFGENISHHYYNKKTLLFQELSPHYKFQSSIDHLRFHPIHLPAISSEEFQLSQILNLQKQKLPGSCLTALIDSIVNLDELRQAPSY